MPTALRTDPTSAVIGAAMTVHSELGPSVLESTYEHCLLIELQHLGVDVRRQVQLPLTYRGVRIDAAYRIDLLVENALVVELKAVTQILPVHEAQLLSYLKLSGYRLGLLLNFHTVSLRDGIRRKVNGF